MLCKIGLCVLIWIRGKDDKVLFLFFYLSIYAIAKEALQFRFIMWLGWQNCSVALHWFQYVNSWLLVSPSFVSEFEIGVQI